MGYELARLLTSASKAKRDRERAEDDYEVNLQAEVEIKALHEKLDQLAAQIEPFFRK